MEKYCQDHPSIISIHQIPSEPFTLDTAVAIVGTEVGLVGGGIGVGSALYWLLIKRRVDRLNKEWCN